MSSETFDTLSGIGVALVLAFIALPFYILPFADETIADGLAFTFRYVWPFSGLAACAAAWALWNGKFTTPWTYYWAVVMIVVFFGPPFLAAMERLKYSAGRVFGAIQLILVLLCAPFYSRGLTNYSPTGRAATVYYMRAWRGVQRRLLLSRGLKGTATITNKFRSDDKNFPDAVPSEWIIEVQYHHGQEYPLETIEVAPEVWSAHEVGQQVPIRYDSALADHVVLDER